MVKVLVDLDEAVNRFLAWMLPENFNPDGGISFKPKFNEGTPYEMKHEPVGTNLFDADQARGMLRHVFGMVDEKDCPGHFASEGDAQVCGSCGIHISELGR